MKQPRTKEEVIADFKENPLRYFNANYDARNYEFRDDADSMRELVGLYNGFFGEASTRLLNDKQFVMDCLKLGVEFEYAGRPKMDKDVATAAVSMKGRSLKYASPELQADIEVVSAAIAQDGEALEFASKELKSNKSIVSAAVRQDGTAIRFAHDKLRDNEEIALEAVKQNGRSLFYVSDRLRKSKEIVLEACRQDDSAILAASREIMNLVGNKDPVEAIMADLATERKHKLAAQLANKDLGKELLDILDSQANQKFKNAATVRRMKI